MTACALHEFHIPVMGTGFTIDSPIRVAPFGIASVISLVDDLLLEKIREYYCKVYQIPFEPIPRNAEDGRAKRTCAYLDLVHEIVERKISDIRALPFFAQNDKSKYFELLPDSSPLKAEYAKLLDMAPGEQRDLFAQDLSLRMAPGSIDVNIMVKLDRVPRDAKGVPFSDEFSDAKAALRGFAQSKLNSSVVLSAGINQALISYMSEFKNFYRDSLGEIQKKIIIKVSDFRSALIQGKFLAKKGLEVFEFRIESGLNCGGHAFATQGQLLPVLLEEIRTKRASLAEQFRPMIAKFYEKMGWNYLSSGEVPRLTVQGGIGNHGEHLRMIKHYGADATGWGSPFMLVPEATPVDEVTREQLRAAGPEDLYLSEASPLGVPFNNLRRSGSEVDAKRRIEEGKPGSPCPKGFLVSTQEFGERELCTAAQNFQRQKIAKIDGEESSADDKQKAKDRFLVKQCICDHLGNSTLIDLGMIQPDRAPQAVCPGPNLAYFSEIYSLQQMVDHIYGRGDSLVASERPHMFALEVKLYVDYFQNFLMSGKGGESQEYIEIYCQNLFEGMDYTSKLTAEAEAFADENLKTAPAYISEQKSRLESLYSQWKASLS